MATTDPISRESRQFSIRLPQPIWIGLATIVLIFAAVVLELVVPNMRKQAAVREIERLGGTIEMDRGGPAWFRDWWDDPKRISPFDEVVKVDMRIDEVSDSDLKPLRVLSRLKKLQLNGSQITDAGLSVLSGLARLQSLDLSDTRITEAGLAQLKGMIHLEHLELPGLKLTEQGLKELCSLPYLTDVTLSSGGEPANSEFVNIAGACGFDLYWPTDEHFQQFTHQTLGGKSKVTLVYCWASKELKWDNESLDFDLAKHVAFQLNGKQVTVVDPDRVYTWIDKHDRWRKSSEIGAAFKADYIVHIDVKDYSLTETHVNNLYRGRADCLVSVVKMDWNKKDGSVVYTTRIRSCFPKDDPIDQSSMPYSEFKKRYLSFLSDEIGHLLYPLKLYRVKANGVVPNGVPHD
jgi:hypothetical protein